MSNTMPENSISGIEVFVREKAGNMGMKYLVLQSQARHQRWTATGALQEEVQESAVQRQDERDRDIRDESAAKSGDDERDCDNGAGSSDISV